MSFRRRDFPEVLDNLLTEVVGGVAAEAQPFPPPGATPGGPLETHSSTPGQSASCRPMAAATACPRASARASTTNCGRMVRRCAGWRAGDLPDEGSIVHVNYLREDVPPTLTDLQVGSVLRTLTEWVSLEIARLYAQLDAVYDAAFIDTATGSALEKVVAVLGIARVRGNRAARISASPARPALRGALPSPPGRASSTRGRGSNTRPPTRSR